mgnify:CR=1 FL=1
MPRQQLHTTATMTLAAASPGVTMKGDMIMQSRLMGGFLRAFVRKLVARGEVVEKTAERALVYPTGFTTHETLGQTISNFSPKLGLTHNLGGRPGAETEPHAVAILYVTGHLTEPRVAYCPAKGLDGVDPGRVVLWGISLGGGHVVSVAADRADVAAVVSVVPLVDGLAAARLAVRHHRPGEVLQRLVRVHHRRRPAKVVELRPLQRVCVGLLERQRVHVARAAVRRAERAMHAGLVNRVVPMEQLDSAVNEFTDAICRAMDRGGCTN